MGTTLTNGVYLPNEGERNCYAGLKTNWEILDQKVADVTALQQAVAGALHREIVESLPTTDIDPNTIYMILSGTSATENVYNEFMYVNNAWELIGTSATDLTNYYTKSEVDDKLLLKANASDLTSHTGDTTIHVTANDKDKWTNSANTHVLRLAKSALTPSSSTNAFSNLDDATALKVGDKVMDTAGVLFEVTAIDTANSTFTIGTALIDLALDSDVVHKSGNETIGGIKTFDSNTLIYNSDNTATTPNLYLKNSKIEISSQGNTSGDQNLTFLDKNNTDYAYVKGVIQSNGSAIKIRSVAKDSSNNTVINELQLLAYTNGNKAVFPSYSNEINLGMSSYKWKSFNGVEPSSLSMPDLDNGIDISSYITVVANANKESLYTPPANGWVSVALTRTSGSVAVMLKQGNLTSSGHRIDQENATATCNAMLPVKGGVQVSINSALADGIVSAYFYPCLGNV